MSLPFLLPQNDSSLDENGVAAAILPLATAFYRASIVFVFFHIFAYHFSGNL